MCLLRQWLVLTLLLCLSEFETTASISLMGISHVNSDGTGANFPNFEFFVFKSNSKGGSLNSSYFKESISLESFIFYLCSKGAL